MSTAYPIVQRRAPIGQAGYKLAMARAVVTASCLTLLPIAGWAAGGISLPFRSAHDSALGFAAGVTLNHTPESAYLNPAGLADLPHPVLTLDATAVNLKTRFRGVGRIDDTANAPFIPGSEGGNPGGVSIIPGVAIAHPVGSRIGIGLALTSDGIDFQYRDDWVGRYHGIDTRIQAPTLSLALGFAAGQQLAIGFGARLQYLNAELLNHIDLGRALERELQQQCPAMLPLPDAPLPAGLGALQPDALVCSGMVPDGDLAARYDFSNHLLADGFGVGWHAGLQWSAGTDTRLGITYFSPVSQHLSGKARRNRFGPGHDGEPGWDAEELRNDPDLAEIRTFLNSRALATGGPGFEELVVAPAMTHSENGRIRSPLSYPEGVSVGFRQRFGERFTLYAAGHWTRWSRLDVLHVNFRDERPPITRALGLSDSTMFSIGLEMKHRKLVYRLGMARESGCDAVSCRVARAPDGNRRHFTLGLGWQWHPRLQLDLAATYTSVDARRVHELETAAGHVLTGPMAAPQVVAGGLRARLVWP